MTNDQKEKVVKVGLLETFAEIIDTLYGTPMGASGENHAPGQVPDPGETTGTSKFLREDGTWNEPTKEQLGLNNVGNFKAVSTEASLDLTSAEQSNARTNIGLGSMATKNSLEASDIPSISKNKISDFPSSMPASDVHEWAKASNKPSYNKSEVGLNNVDNTADADKNVNYANSAGDASTVGGYGIQVVTSMPASPDANTIYIVK